MWSEVTLDAIKSDEKSSLVSGPFGSNIGSRFFVEQGIPVIRGNNLTLGEEKFIEDGFVFITEEKARELKNCNAKSGDIIFTAAGTLGQVGLIPPTSKYETYIISNKQIRLRLNTNRCEPLFVYYCLSAPHMRSFIASQNKGSSVPLLTLGIVRNLKISIPILDVQKKIAAILSAYDELIENNQRRIALLEKMAEEIYREWFVRLRFPGHEKVKKVMGVPEGWKTKPLPELADITYGFPFDGSRFNTDGIGKPIIRIRNIPESSTSDYTDEVALDKHIVHHGDLLVGMDGEFHINHWYGEESYLVQRVCRMKARNPVLEGYLFHAIRAPIKHFESILLGATVGHLGAMHLKSINLLEPPDELLPQLEMLNDLHRQKLLLGRTVRKLSRVRDLLLPRLISGKLSVEYLDIQFPPGMEESVHDIGNHQRV